MIRLEYIVCIEFYGGFLSIAIRFLIIGLLQLFCFSLAAQSGNNQNIPRISTKVFFAKHQKKIKFSKRITSKPLIFRKSVIVIPSESELLFYNLNLELSKTVKLKGYISDLVPYTSSSFIVKASDGANSNQYLWEINLLGEIVQSHSLPCFSTTAMILEHSKETVFFGCRRTGLNKISMKTGAVEALNVGGVLKNIIYINGQVVFNTSGGTKLYSVDLGLNPIWELEFINKIDRIIQSNSSTFVLDRNQIVSQVNSSGEIIVTNNLGNKMGDNLFTFRDKLWTTKKVFVDEYRSYSKLFHLNENLVPIENLDLPAGRIVSLVEVLNDHKLFTINYFSWTTSLLFDGENRPVSAWQTDDVSTHEVLKLDEDSLLIIDSDGMTIRSFVHSFDRSFLPKILDGPLQDFQKTSNEKFILTSNDEIALMSSDLSVINKLKLSGVQNINGPIETTTGYAAVLDNKEIAFFNEKMEVLFKGDAPLVSERDNIISRPLMHSSGKVILVSEKGQISTYTTSGVLENSMRAEELLIGSTLNKFLELKNSNLLVVNSPEESAWEITCNSHYLI